MNREGEGRETVWSPKLTNILVTSEIRDKYRECGLKPDISVGVDCRGLGTIEQRLSGNCDSLVRIYISKWGFIQVSWAFVVLSLACKLVYRG